MQVPSRDTRAASVKTASEAALRSDHGSDAANAPAMTASHCSERREFCIAVWPPCRVCMMADRAYPSPVVVLVGVKLSMRRQFDRMCVPRPSGIVPQLLDRTEAALSRIDRHRLYGAVKLTQKSGNRVPSARHNRERLQRARLRREDGRSLRASRQVATRAPGRMMPPVSAAGSDFAARARLGKRSEALQE